MAITRIQSKLATGTGTSLGLTPDTAPANGNCMLLAISYNSSTASRVTSITHTNATWTRAVQANHATVAVSEETWYSLDAASAGSSLTINMASSFNVAAIYVEYSGVATVSALDQTASLTETGGGE